MNNIKHPLIYYIKNELRNEFLSILMDYINHDELNDLMFELKNNLKKELMKELKNDLMIELNEQKKELMIELNKQKEEMMFELNKQKEGMMAELNEQKEELKKYVTNETLVKNDIMKKLENCIKTDNKICIYSTAPNNQGRFLIHNQDIQNGDYNNFAQFDCLEKNDDKSVFKIRLIP